MPLTPSRIQQFAEWIGDAAVAAARHAEGHLGAERIYGFCLYHGQFLYIGATVFTEAGLAQVEAKYRARGYGTDGLRWSPCDSPHHLIADSFFDRINAQLSVLARDEYDADTNDPDDDPGAGREAAVEGSALRALARVRREVIVAPDILLTLMEGDQSDSQRVAYAERLNASDALERFRGWCGSRAGFKDVEFYRSRMPAF